MRLRTVLVLSLIRYLTTCAINWSVKWSIDSVMCSHVEELTPNEAAQCACALALSDVEYNTWSPSILAHLRLYTDAACLDNLSPQGLTQLMQALHHSSPHSDPIIETTLSLLQRSKVHRALYPTGTVSFLLQIFVDIQHPLPDRYPWISMAAGVTNTSWHTSVSIWHVQSRYHCSRSKWTVLCEDDITGNDWPPLGDCTGCSFIPIG